MLVIKEEKDQEESGHCQRKVRRAEFSAEDRKLGRRDPTPLGDRGGAFDLEMVP